MVGLEYGVRARKEGDELGRVGIALNGLVLLGLTGLTLVGGVLDGC